MSKIRDKINEYKPPKSIWKPTIYESYNKQKSVKFTRVEDEDREIDVTDKLATLVAKKISVDYDRTTLKFKVNVDNAYYHIRQKIKEDIESAYEENSTKLHPMKTKVGKWLIHSGFLKSDATEDVVLSLWKYIADNRNDETHMKNAYKIIEVLHTKYSDLYKGPTSPSRRHRRW